MRFIEQVHEAVNDQRILVRPNGPSSRGLVATPSATQEDRAAASRYLKLHGCTNQVILGIIAVTGYFGAGIVARAFGFA
ncbi:hypothetical protein SAMN02745129_2511 [Ferrimonas marina]|uniref:Uncharacterized protein n=1 Tax=Ferrimonas marina TaxID=299255 RepID=A0A1M5UD64_9GAMM|nr:hypothetical protein SAMN02745129_2511 [Ferrimonas marina]